jgi:DNA-binding IclR family transcriptional regulator
MRPRFEHVRFRVDPVVASRDYMTSATGTQTTVPGLERGLKLLRLFRRTRPSITPPEIAHELKIPRSTVHRLLQTLEEMEFLRRAESGGAYVLGPAVLSIGFDYLSSLDIVQLSNPVLSQLRDKTQCSAHLAVLHGTEIVYLSRQASPNAVTSNVSVGTRLPAHATVMGRVLLADLASAALHALYKNEPLQRFTPKTPTSVASLERLLVEDRRLGYVIGSSYYERGVTSVAAPVRDQAGKVVAAINVAIVDTLVEESALYGRITAETCAAAASVSAMMGAPMPAPPLEPVLSRRKRTVA